MTKILFVITAADHWTLADGTRQPTGFWAEEALGPYQIFKEAGYQIAAATPGGVPPTVDVLSLSPDFNNGEEGAERMRTALREATELAHPMRIEDVTIDDYEAVFYPGGWGPMEDLPGDAASGKLLTDWITSGKPVSLVCHGPAALLATIGPDGTSPYAGYRLPASPTPRSSRTDWRTARSGCSRTASSASSERTTVRPTRSPRTSKWTAPCTPARTRSRRFRWLRSWSRHCADGLTQQLSSLSAVEYAPWCVPGIRVPWKA
ncbi:hypothetical protein GCM10010303_40940 [Streptomyces purpurascens]|nr:hypothetical protein GCM10010303_40940 [Streptomyces purpurascens]